MCSWKLVMSTLFPDSPSMLWQLFNIGMQVWEGQKKVKQVSSVKRTSSVNDIFSSVSTVLSITDIIEWHCELLLQGSISPWSREYGWWLILMSIKYVWYIFFFRGLFGKQGLQCQGKKTPSLLSMTCQLDRRFWSHVKLDWVYACAYFNLRAHYSTNVNGV